MGAGMGGIEEEAAGHAAFALGNLGHSNKANSVAILGAGAVPPLVALLSGGPKSQAAAQAASALAILASNIAAAITEAGAIAPLVALLSGGPKSEAAGPAASALKYLASNIAANKAAIIEAGAIPLLVALLSGGADSEAADNAASALLVLACGTIPTAVLEEMARKQIDLSSWPTLREGLCKRASAGLLAAEAGTAVAALERAITLAAAVQMDAADLERAQKRLRVINGDAERQERRESFGLGSLELPDEFVCPITMDQMRGVPPPPSQHAPLAHRRHTCPACAADPVVASDGHSYERSAILSVLRDGNGLSPLTRERLQPNVLILNRNLKRRMQEHDEDILRAAATAVANASDGAQQQGPAACGGEPSSEPAPKRSHACLCVTVHDHYGRPRLSRVCLCLRTLPRACVCRAVSPPCVCRNGTPQARQYIDCSVNIHVYAPEGAIPAQSLAVRPLLLGHPEFCHLSASRPRLAHPPWPRLAPAAPARATSNS
eukprot:scaffold51100_cov61-Phaeocystis_antarctica.AAC.2